ncbi:FKBP-type peptidyl-prolyl cis-trans isomerase [Cryobacterium frigoriphilum]|uniref:FKBP-type peptidyl-prolyl cis-trans isomerase n=1 Tax=Cryobacterium frigoriphilum TaxID=1259150 RepID=UPI00141B02DD|nr:FKBP-type peptidyl-prolyl cis-trans isomerase [Cryobacterium frigoriphilum]
MRKQIALIATAGLLMAALTACSGPGATAADCDVPVTDGPAADLVSVTGDLGTAPVVDFPTPLKTDTTQRAVLIEGEGEPTVSGQRLGIELSVYNGTSGELIEQSPYSPTSAAPVTLNDEALTGLRLGLTCAQAGSRVAIVVAPDDGFGPQDGNAQLGVASTDSLIFVVDIVKTYLTRANGADQAPEAGLPSVVLNDDGRPGITIPAGDVPTELEVGVLKKGAGEKIAEGQVATLHYTGVIWGEDKTVFDSSWENGAPVPLMAVDGSTTQGGIIPGFATALIGQTVGSQIVAVIPPELAYGATASGTIPANSTLIFVVDILGVD